MRRQEPCREGRVHPRAGGGAAIRQEIGYGRSGPSPRRRGEPPAASACSASDTIHPRPGGGASTDSPGRRLVRGPSPRRRGSLDRQSGPAPGAGSIPAQAGEPGGVLIYDSCLGVHPRAVGGARTYDIDLSTGKGPSPRRRGSRARMRGQPDRRGSIPAQAGEPRLDASGACCPRVHPRAGGGALLASLAGLFSMGPSPRRRGSHAGLGVRKIGHGSIPAQAGEPAAPPTSTTSTQVHPRAGGGAVLTRVLGGDPEGPSPRRRGSRSVHASRLRS